MRYLVIASFLALAACGDGPVTKANAAYAACIDAKGVDGCRNEKAKLDAALAVADAQSRRNAAAGPLVLKTYQPPSAQPIYQPPVNCIKTGDLVNCY